MKQAGTIVILMVALAVSAVELRGQNASSAAQVVTFGVHRVAMAAPSTSSLSSSMLKVTAGDQSQVQSSVEPSSTIFDRSNALEATRMIAGAGVPASGIAARKTNVLPSKLPVTKALPSDPFMLTVTE
jgi:hypothetical protein